MCLNWLANKIQIEKTWLLKVAKDLHSNSVDEKTLVRGLTKEDKQFAQLIAELGPGETQEGCGWLRSS